MSCERVLSLLDLCREKGLRMVTAESCTGGLIGGALTEVPGSSDVFWGGFMTYANEAKVNILGVDENVLKDKGAVSSEVVTQMLRGALEKSGTDLALAVSGVAGPGGGTEEKPVGTVWIGAATAEGRLCTRRYLFKGNRREVRQKTVVKSLEMAEKIILNDSCLDSE